MIWIAVVLGVVLGWANAQAIEPNDFAYGYRLEVSEDGAIYVLTLSEAVYRGITRADRGDLRIFNSSGVAVPHAFQRPERQKTQPHPEQDVPYFPLYGEARATGGEYNVRITTNAQGAIIDVKGANGATAGRPLTAYLLDASHLPQHPHSLTFVWPETHAPFVMTVRLEGSNDLHRWRRVLHRAVLSHLHYGGHRLLQQRLDLPRTKTKYLRLTWEGNTSLQLDTIRAHFAATSQEHPRQWTSFMVTRSDTEHQAYVFDTQAYLPTDRVRLQLPQRNSLVRAAIETSRNPDGPWQTLSRGILYDLEVHDTRLTTPPLTPGIRRERYWRLRLLETETQLGGLPTLQLGWVPEQLYFVAQGTTPFTLAYGSSQIGPAKAPLAEFLRQDTLHKQHTLVKTAHLGVTVSLGDAALLQPTTPPVPWKRYILWTVLLVGVLALAAMAWHLYKHMQQDSAEGGTP